MGVPTMSSPTVGITILIILAFANLMQLLMQRSDQSKRHKDLQERLQRIEARIGS